MVIKQKRWVLKHGYETKVLREQFGLKKTSNKKQKTFNSHAVDSWVLAASLSGAKKIPLRQTKGMVLAQTHTGFS